jgi:hypothetical protein
VGFNEKIKSKSLKALKILISPMENIIYILSPFTKISTQTQLDWGFCMSNVSYLPAPDLFGTWKDSGDLAALTEPKEDVSVFKFIKSNDASLAFFSICDTDDAKRTAIRGLRSWMSSTCVSDDFAPANTRSLNTVKDGIAERQADGSWKVKEHAKVEYEA